MKKNRAISFLGSVVLGFAVSTAVLTDLHRALANEANLKQNKKTKAEVTVSQSDKDVNIVVKPKGDYKWNAEYPASLKFSVCNPHNCIIVEEKIKLDK